MTERRELFTELQPLVTSFDAHPWSWAAHQVGERTPRRNEGFRWNAGKDLSLVPPRPERVVEVRYDHMERERFRHTAQFNRWRPTAPRRGWVNGCRIGWLAERSGLCTVVRVLDHWGDVLVDAE